MPIFLYCTRCRIYAHIAHEFGDILWLRCPGILKVEKFTEITPGNFLVSWVLPLGYPEKFLGFLGYPEKFLGFLGYPGKFLGFLGFPWVIPGIFLVSWVFPLKIMLFFEQTIKKTKKTWMVPNPRNFLGFLGYFSENSQFLGFAFSIQNLKKNDGPRNFQTFGAQETESRHFPKKY